MAPIKTAIASANLPLLTITQSKGAQRLLANAEMDTFVVRVAQSDPMIIHAQSIHGQYSQLQHVQHVQRVSTVPQAQAPSLLALLASIVTVLTPIPLSVPEEHMEQPQAWYRRLFALNAQLVKLAPNLA